MRWFLAFLLPFMLIGCQLGASPDAGTVGSSSSATTSFTADASLPDIMSVADQVTPAVVHIRTQTVATNFRRSVNVEGTGTGVIITSNGLILTNDHVIDGARSITVTLEDGRSFEASVVGRDTSSDLAILRVNASGLPALTFADQSDLRVGQWVIAIGNALDLPGGPTVTVGVISALDRSIEEPNGVDLEDVVQTDAAINPGNSGGPLLNLSGEIVGINTVVSSQAEGIGFAVSSEVAERVVLGLVAQAL
jgi:serine protease Do